ncbi:MAG: AMP-binding protein, partial [Pyrinomonadaceae bacterium]
MTAENLVGFDRIPQTIPHFCFESFTRHNKRDALAFKVDDVWNYISGIEAVERVKRIAMGLAAMGIKAGDRVAIISENRPEWSLVDLAILSLRAVNVPIYTTQAVEQIR